VPQFTLRPIDHRDLRASCIQSLSSVQSLTRPCLNSWCESEGCLPTYQHVGRSVRDRIRSWEEAFAAASDQDTLTAGPDANVKARHNNAAGPSRPTHNSRLMQGITCHVVLPRASGCHRCCSSQAESASIWLPCNRPSSSLIFL
jgi:hypothetical protein